jgi:hypothetical protein
MSHAQTTESSFDRRRRERRPDHSTGFEGETAMGRRWLRPHDLAGGIRNTRLADCIDPNAARNRQTARTADYDSDP